MESELKISQANSNKYLFQDKIVEPTNPYVELYRGKLYNYLLKKFIRLCVTKLGKDVFSIKKSYPRTVTNILSSWMFYNYSKYDFSKDPFIPDKSYGDDILKQTILDLAKHLSVEKQEEIKGSIDNLFEEIDIENIIILLNQKMDEYKTSEEYLNQKDTYFIEKNMIYQIRYEKKILFYKFIVNVSINVSDKRLVNILDNILLPKYEYERLVSKYKGPPEKMDFYIWAILFRYQILGSNNNQLAVLPRILNQLQKDFNLDFECFGSAINSNFSQFNSLYYDIEKYFGSRGNFFNFFPINGTYSFNPPYQLDIINDSIERLMFFLDKANSNNEELSFIITIPIWDEEGKEQLNNNNIKYNEFTAMKKIRSSKYLKALRMLSKEDFTYIDHNFYLFKNTTIQNTYVIVLSTSDKMDFSKIDKYDFKSY